MEENKKVYKLQIKVLYKNKERNATMSILDIGLPTGYIYDKNDLDSLSSGHDRIIQKYEMNEVLSEKGSLIIYLDTVSNKLPDEISFKIQQTMKVGVLQPAAVSVYEYYNMKKCVKYYRPEREKGELLKLCQNNECICAEENCSKQRKEKIQNKDRTNKACESTETSKIDYVYKVEVIGFYTNFTTDVYSMRILNATKEGNTDKSPQGKLRDFIGYQHCRDALDLKEGKKYLLMGSSSDIYVHRESLQYVLGQDTWVEYWPTAEECRERKYQHTCLEMEKMIRELPESGCRTK